MKAVKSVLFFVAIATHQVGSAQIVVNDPASFQQWVLQIQEMKAQYEQMQADFTLAQQNFESMTGGRGLGQIHYDGSLSGMISNPGTVFDGNADARAIMEQERQTGASNADMQRAIELRSLQTYASLKAASQQAHMGAMRRLAQIESLMASINQTQDPKAIQELQGRLMAETATLQNEQNRHQINMQAANAEQRLIEEQRRSFSRKILDNSNTSMPRIK